MTQRLRQAGLPLAAAVLVMALAVSGSAQTPAPSSGAPAGTAPRPTGSVAPAASGVVNTPAVDPTAPPPGYLIGADDILTIKVWQDEKMSGDVVVRPDGKVTLALINDIQAAGLTPDQFRAALTAAAEKFVRGPTVDVLVKQVNSRRIYITGEVKKPDVYPLRGRMTILQLISVAGGFTEYADRGKITILRVDDTGKTVLLKVNHNDIMNGKNLQQNYELKVGDVVTIPD